MFSNAELQLIYKFMNAPVNAFPFPHFYVQNIFPDALYAELQRNIPDPAAMLPIAQVRPVIGYKERFVLELSGRHLERVPPDKQKFWQDLSRVLLGSRFAHMLLRKFKPQIEQRFRDTPNVQFREEAMLVEDITNYKLGPHTDSTQKVITVVFYLPADESKIDLGTSIYIPRDSNFRCPGGTHYKFDGFERVTTMPYAPNSVFCFLKTDLSFHGVERVVRPDAKRWLLLYDIYVNADAPLQQQTAVPAQAQNVLAR